jgi:hypothetical protein
MIETFDIQIVSAKPDAGFTIRVIPPVSLKLESFTATRQLPTIPARMRSLMKSLRGGSAPLRQVDDLAEQVSGWLLDEQLTKILADAIDRLQNASLLRLRLSVDPTDATLRAHLGNMPFELLTRDPNFHGPLLLEPRIVSLVHLIQGQSALPAAPTAPIRAAPMRVLLVRSSPRELDVVPPARPIQEYITALALRGSVVDLLSSEPDGNASGPPTYEQLIRHLRMQPSYHILVYFGHADVEEQGGNRLILEKLDRGEDAQPIQGIRSVCQVPVVLLVGCLTAAHLPPNRHKEIDNYARGSQGAAQTLAMYSRGPQVAVGMRDRLDTEQAQLFLNTFFQSLLQTTPGDVEQAVRAGRAALHDRWPVSAVWSAPMLFRKPGDEPTFDLGMAPQLPTKTLTRRDYLRDNGFTPQGVERFFKTKLSSKSDWLAEEFVVRDVPIRTDTEIRTISDLMSTESLVLFGPPGYGKTSHFFELARLAQNKSVLIVEVTDLSALLGKDQVLELFRDLIMEKALTELHNQISRDPAQKTKYARWQSLKQDETSVMKLHGLFQVFCEPGTQIPEIMLPGEDLRKWEQWFERSKRNQGYTYWIEQLSEVATKAGFQSIYLLVDCVDERLSQNAHNQQALLTTLRELLRQTPVGLTFATKFALPLVLGRLLIDANALERTPFGVYHLEHWRVDQLCSMLEERIRLYTRSGNSATSLLHEFHELCDGTVPKNICEWIAMRAEGSPSKLLEDIKKIIDLHCSQQHDSKALINRSTIEEALNASLDE